MGSLKTLLLLGRPASGKSELIDFLKNLSLKERLSRYHVGAITELDDFVWLWEKFLEDDLWEQAGEKRRYSARENLGYVITDRSLLDYCLARFNEEFPKQPKGGTIFVEFSRGLPDGGYQHALSKLSDALLKDAAILFVHTSYEEACRRNEARYQEKLRHSVLAHKVPPKDMERFGKEIDWLQRTQKQPSGFLSIRRLQVPFVTLQNEPELKDNQALAQRYQEAFSALYDLANS